MLNWLNYWATMLRGLSVWVMLIMVACTSDPNVTAGRPRLVQAVTLPPTDVVSRTIATPTPIVIPLATAADLATLEVITVAPDDPNFVLVTATLPPSRTPTLTPTITPTVTRTPLPSPTLAIRYVQQTVAPGIGNTGPQACPLPWFFGLVLPTHCPLGPALTSPAAYQSFQQGFMIWVGQQDAIYAIYQSPGPMRWEVFRDDYVEGLTVDFDPALDASAPDSTWQPRRGFGLIWRNNPLLQSRLGWATVEREEPYTIQVQIATDGSIFFVEPRGGIIGLQPGGREWIRYR